MRSCVPAIVDRETSLGTPNAKMKSYKSTQPLSIQKYVLYRLIFAMAAALLPLSIYIRMNYSADEQLIDCFTNSDYWKSQYRFYTMGIFRIDYLNTPAKELLPSIILVCFRSSKSILREPYHNGPLKRSTSDIQWGWVVKRKGEREREKGEMEEKERGNGKKWKQKKTPMLLTGAKYESLGRLPSSSLRRPHISILRSECYRAVSHNSNTFHSSFLLLRGRILYRYRALDAPFPFCAVNYGSPVEWGSWAECINGSSINPLSGIGSQANIEFVGNPSQRRLVSMMVRRRGRKCGQ